MVLKCIKFTRKTSLVHNYNGLAMIELYSAYLLSLATKFTYNLASPVPFSLFFICNLHLIILISKLMSIVHTIFISGL